MPDDCRRRARDDSGVIGVPWVDESVPFAACQDPVHDQHRLSPLPDPSVAKVPRHEQTRAVPTVWKVGLVVPLDSHRGINGCIDRHIHAPNPPHAGVGQARQHRAGVGATRIEDIDPG